MVKKLTAMERLLREGFFDSKEDALPYLMSGAVLCGAIPVKTGGQLVSAESPMWVRGLNDRYVGKGGYKLEGAIADFHIAVKERVCIDAGACTGGFTDCLIKHEAGLVYAVEVGFGQLAGMLAQNSRVVNLEKTNLGDERLLALDPVPTLGSVDLSYLSLVKAVPQFRAIMQGRGELMCLVKPLFETENPQARRTGELSTEAYLPILTSLISALNAQPETRVLNVTNSPVTGNHGTHEFFLHVAFGPGDAAQDLSGAANGAVERSLGLSKYRKSV